MLWQWASSILPHSKDIRWCKHLTGLVLILGCVKKQRRGPRIQEDTAMVRRPCDWRRHASACADKKENKDKAEYTWATREDTSRSSGRDVGEQSIRSRMGAAGRLENRNRGTRYDPRKITGCRPNRETIHFEGLIGQAKRGRSCMT